MVNESELILTSYIGAKHKMIELYESTAVRKQIFVDIFNSNSQ